MVVCLYQGSAMTGFGAGIQGQHFMACGQQVVVCCPKMLWSYMLADIKKLSVHSLGDLVEAAFCELECWAR